MENTCYRHASRTARIVCQRCDRPICPDCMIQGSVGFHCPECVRNAPQPKVRVRRFEANQATSLALIGLNVAVWLAILVSGWSRSPLIQWLALTPEGACVVDAETLLLADAATCVEAGFRWVPGVATGALWQLLTSAFSHVELWHIGFNMMALFVLGPQLERMMGRWRFLAVYLFSALTASAVVVAFSEPHTLTLGASGSLFGMMGAVLVITLRQGHNPRAVLFWLGLNAVITFVVPNVSWQGHLGGLLGGIAVTALLVYLPRRLRRLEWAFMALATVAVLGAIAATVLLRFW